MAFVVIVTVCVCVRVFGCVCIRSSLSKKQRTEVSNNENWKWDTKDRNQWEVHIKIMIYDGTAGTLLNCTHNSLADIHAHTDTHTHLKGIWPPTSHPSHFIPRSLCTW